MGRHNVHLPLIPVGPKRQGQALALALCCALAVMAGCVQPTHHAVAAAASERLDAWIADWDLQRGMAEWKANPGLFDAVHVFAAYFDDKDAPFLAQDWERLLGGNVKSVFGSTPTYLTVVNDLAPMPGKPGKLKDPALVHRLVSDPAVRERHIVALLDLAGRYKFTGLEIDYENVDPADWPDFLTFVAALQQAAQGRGLALSVVLQPQSRYLTKPLPAGPLYVLMGYNLFGSHSGPGPKATPSFLAEQASALRSLGVLDHSALALATGGFDWTEGKAAKQLTETEAADVVAKRQASSSRQAGDGYLVSRYRDEKGQAHEVWHADAETLATLWKASASAGFKRLAVWRLGGNAPGLFDMLRSLKRSMGG